MKITDGSSRLRGLYYRPFLVSSVHIFFKIDTICLIRKRIFGRVQFRWDLLWCTWYVAYRSDMLNKLVSIRKYQSLSNWVYFALFKLVPSLLDPSLLMHLKLLVTCSQTSRVLSCNLGCSVYLLKKYAYHRVVRKSCHSLQKSNDWNK